MRKIERVEIEIHLDNGAKIPITLNGDVLADPTADVGKLIRQAHARELIRWNTLALLPMVPPPPGPIEKSAEFIREFVEDGLAEMRGDVAHRTKAGDDALRDMGLA